ncbi:MAG TPA: hypothetical protein VFG69_07515 [Nannocystaceae bacterium]|nr:hypothetical protein [Nannocystaceae bacterium]
MVVGAILLACACAPPIEAAPEDGATGTTAVAQDTTIVLLAVDSPDAAERAEAISGHVHGLAELVAADARAPDDDPTAWYELALAEAERRSAFAVFWVTVQDGDYVLSVVRPGRREIRWRRIAVDPGSPSAGIETLGIIARATTSALLADSALQMETTPIPEPPPAPAKPTAAPSSARASAVSRAPRGRAVLAVAYAGTSYAREIPWQSGLALEAGWAWRNGLQATVGYTVYQRARAESSLGRVEVVRHPITALVGYHRRHRALGYGGDAGFVLDYTERRASTRMPGVDVGPDRGRPTTAFTVRARASVIAVWRLEVFAAIALEAWFSQVRYAVQAHADEREVVLTPRRVRAIVAAGLAIRL